MLITDMSRISTTTEQRRTGALLFGAGRAMSRYPKEGHMRGHLSVRAVRLQVRTVRVGAREIYTDWVDAGKPTEGCRA